MQRVKIVWRRRHSQHKIILNLRQTWENATLWVIGLLNLSVLNSRSK
jgi:hypothetical protein